MDRLFLISNIRQHGSQMRLGGGWNHR